MTNILFRAYGDADYVTCLDIFDANCPVFFAPNERQEYEDFLDNDSKGYEVCEVDGRVLGAFGLFDGGQDVKTIHWILLDPRTQGIGVGSKIMERMIHLGRTSETKTVRIATSPKAAPFFAKFGATTTSSTVDGCGPGMDRIDMVLLL